MVDLQQVVGDYVNENTRLQIELNKMGSIHESVLLETRRLQESIALLDKVIATDQIRQISPFKLANN